MEADPYAELRASAMPRESWRAIALFLMRRMGRQQPKVFELLASKALEHSRGWDLMPVFEKRAPGFSLAFVRQFESELELLNIGRGQNKPDLAIPRKSLWFAYDALQWMVRELRRALNSGGCEAASQFLWRGFKAWLENPGEIAKSQVELCLLLQADKRAVWRVMMHAYCCSFSITLTAGTLNWCIERCTSKTPPGLLSLEILGKICGVTPDHIQGEVNRYKPRKSRRPRQ